MTSKAEAFKSEFNEAVFADMPSKALPEWTRMRFNSNSEAGRWIAHAIEALTDLARGEVEEIDKPETMDYIVLALQNAYDEAINNFFEHSVINETVAAAGLAWIGAPLR